MALTLNATARLNTTPFTKSLSALSQAVAAANKGELASATKAMTADQQRIAQRVQGAQAITAATKAQTAAENAAASAGSRLSTGLAAQRYLYSDLSRVAGQYAITMAALPAVALGTAAAWERSFVDVVRTSDPVFADSEAAVAKLRGEMVSLVQSMPTSWGDVTEIATLANQMGIASSETTKFTTAVAMFSATSNVSVDQAATSFARLKAIVPDVQSDYMGLADSILKVGVNSVATESEIINIVTQISSIAGAAGMSSRDMIGLAGALASVRVPPELSRGVITRTFGQISRAVADGGASLAGFAKIAGVSAADFREAWGTEASGDLFKQFVSGLQKLGPQAEAELRGLGITSVRDVPVLIRLATAANSEGEAGKLLEQTMADASNAAGETQRQYSMVAETIASKFKILGNSILVFFDAIGQQGIDFLGDSLDFVTGKIQDFTASLDKAAKIGSFELPWTNAEVFAFGAAASVAAGGLLALGSGALKMFSTVAAVRQASGVFATFGKQATVAGRAQTTFFTGVGDRYRRLGTQVASVGKSFTSFGAGASVVNGVGRAFNSTATAVTSAARTMGTAASIAFGPWGFFLGTGALALSAWLESTRAASTTASELAQSLASTGDAMRALASIEIGHIGGGSTNPLKAGLGTLAAYREESKALIADTETLKKLNSFDDYGAMGTAAAVAGADSRAVKDYSQALTTLNDAYKEMSAAGNGNKGLASILGSTKDYKALMDDLNSGNLDSVRNDFEALFDLGKKEFSAKGLEDLANGKLPTLTEALYGTAAAVGYTTDEMKVLDAESEAFSNTAKLVEEVAAEFIKYGAAIEAAGEKGQDLGKFTDTLNEQIATQTKWAENLNTIGGIGGFDAINAFAGLGAEGAEVLDSIVANFHETGGAVDGAWKAAMDAVIASTNNAAVHIATDLAAARQLLSNALLDTELTSQVQSSVSPEAFTKVSGALSAIAEKQGREAATKFAQGIVDNADAPQAAMASVFLEEYKITVNPAFDLTSAELSINTLQSIADGTTLVMDLDALPKLAQDAIWDTVQMADGTMAYVQLNADGTLARNELTYIDQETGKPRTVVMEGNNLDALAKALEARGAVENGAAVLTITANDMSVRLTAVEWAGKTIATAYVDVLARDGDLRVSTGYGSGRITKADGGIVDYYANGGIRNENHVAQIAPAGTWRVWAEEETGGEAYIPLAAAKRARSEKILSEVAGRFGMVVSKAAQYADGGYYYAQQGSRNSRGISQASLAQMTPRVQVGQVTFESGEQHEQFREFSRTLNRIARGVR